MSVHIRKGDVEQPMDTAAPVEGELNAEEQAILANDPEADTPVEATTEDTTEVLEPGNDATEQEA